jgi:hypothetical protein
VTPRVNAAGCIRVVPEIFQALREVNRRDERRKEQEEDEDTSGNRMHVVGRREWGTVRLERVNILVYICIWAE